MPEGPEVRHCAEVLNRAIGGKTITRIEFISGKLARTGPLRGEVNHLNLPAVVRNVHAYGKRIIIVFDNLSSMTSTLGMSGWWFPGELYAGLYSHEAYEKIEAVKHHVRLKLIGDNSEVLASFADARNFGNVSFYDKTEASDLTEGIGVDLLQFSTYLPRPNKDSSIWDDKVKALVDRLQASKSKSMIGAYLLDQSKLAGLGNIYRAETLYHAGISPFRAVNDLSKQEFVNLINYACKVLNIAYFTNGKMKYPWIADVNRPDCHLGHSVYGKTVCPRGSNVYRADLGGRTIYYSTAYQS